ncbi:hypothetical protein P5W99_37345 [Paraburkholderia sp. A3BS-1L]|uniref:hypothetical protein n=1 Tax=Paraburkholderia sp. A3BS-1L TaxID=3028375 RepID=UPI003DA86AC3
MDYETSAAELKRKQLHEAALAAGPMVHALPENALESALDALARITPPEKLDFELRLDLCTISSLNTVPRALSRKPGNVLLNWRRLVDVVPDVSLAGFGALTLPVVPPAWAAVLAGLYIWNKLWRGSAEEFSDIEALTMLALWQNRNGKNKINEGDGLMKTNELRAQYKMPPLTLEQYAYTVNRLVEIECIELKNGVIWLREWVRVKYQ